ncbi:23S rRNA (uridine2552-2'-O)-methyltransferase [Desulfobaculum xiamenense]|uniref:Ribosomal RNA large subunit methyltransferase E n=1 Tax=Desulfobaculum xiamenense TaxID=995050 RepID=A0A846QQJ4_9BACT|nr:RlmE family RNA methyltransferase [Desulfobaculum xiamenense]NJB68772.1 23S rRNA (uridine2552-2'-O)-methyltransferase [Desulfobaculum xiamenense]
MKKYRDHYFLKAKRENYPARSVYKLKELNNRFHLFREGQKVMDLGAAPGSWTLYAAERVGEKGFVLSADIQTTETSFPPNVSFHQEDVFERSPEFEAQIQAVGPFDMVISDMAPKTTGHKFTDQARSMNLAEEALAVACKTLVKGGHFVVKVFQGPDDKAYTDMLRTYFASVKTFKPKSSRAESKEIFFVGMEFKGIPKDA